MTVPIAHILGPGGAGKSTVGSLLSKDHGLTVVDMDAYFMKNIGDISRYIRAYGYTAYASKNFQNYLSIIKQASVPTVIALSSGFMTYPQDLAPGYAEVVHKISHSKLSALLLPSFDTEKCVAIIVKRQLQRAYLHADVEQEEARIRERLPLFISFKCAHFLSSIPAEDLATQLSVFFTSQQAKELLQGH